MPSGSATAWTNGCSASCAFPHECGLRLLAAPVDAVEAQDVDEEGIARLVTLARRTFRFVVIDTFPLLDNILLSLLDVSDRLFVVLQGTVPDVVGTARFLEVLDRLGVAASRRRVVLNRNYPPHAGRLTAHDVEDRLGVAGRPRASLPEGAPRRAERGAALRTPTPLALRVRAGAPAAGGRDRRGCARGGFGAAMTERPDQGPLRDVFRRRGGRAAVFDAESGDGKKRERARPSGDTLALKQALQERLLDEVDRQAAGGATEERIVELARQFIEDVLESEDLPLNERESDAASPTS